MTKNELRDLALDTAFEIRNEKADRVKELYQDALLNSGKERITGTEAASILSIEALNVATQLSALIAVELMCKLGLVTEDGAAVQPDSAE